MLVLDVFVDAATGAPMEGYVELGNLHVLCLGRQATNSLAEKTI